jgi:hypothetical protein
VNGRSGRVRSLVGEMLQRNVMVRCEGLVSTHCGPPSLSTRASGVSHNRTIGPEGRDLPLRNKPHFDALILWDRFLRESGRRAALDCPERVDARETTNAGYFFSKPLYVRGDIPVTLEKARLKCATFE